METETSKFESSEMLATFLASTPLLEESWRLCSHANTAAQRSFAVNRVGQSVYVAFSGVQMVACPEDACRNLVELDSRIFTAFSSDHGEGEEPAMVHDGLMQLFLSFYAIHNFRNQMLQLLNECKSVTFTGHSLGGGLASFTALWLLSHIQTTSHSAAIFCITYGSTFLANESFSKVILQQRWGGNFCHIVSQHDMLPRLLFAPFAAPLHAIFEFWQLSMSSPCLLPLVLPLSDEEKAELFTNVLAYAGARSRGEEDRERTPYWPFGSYVFCTDKGAVCLDNAKAIIEWLYLLMANGTPSSCIEDHLRYGEYVAKFCWHYLQNRSFMEVYFSESSSEAGIALALQSSGISCQGPVYVNAKEHLAEARRLGCKRNLNNAKMAVSLAKITPLRAQVEWYKAHCDNSDDQLGYYDSFKQRGASKRGHKVNINRIRLGLFWDELINMLEKNQLTHDFHKLSKYVNASQFYKLLVEPLEIADYYANCMHKEKGHYMEHGRPKRFKIFDRWWRERKVGDEESNPRSKFASLTQDSCFWARVEEAMDNVYRVMSETDPGRRLLLLGKIEEFEQYAGRMIERKEVSVDVLAKNSRYSVFKEEWKQLRSQLHQWTPYTPGFQDRMVQ